MKATLSSSRLKFSWYSTSSGEGSRVMSTTASWGSRPPDPPVPPAPPVPPLPPEPPVPPDPASPVESPTQYLTPSTSAQRFPSGQSASVWHRSSRSFRQPTPPRHSRAVASSQGYGVRRIRVPSSSKREAKSLAQVGREPNFRPPVRRGAELARPEFGVTRADRPPARCPPLRGTRTLGSDSIGVGSRSSSRASEPAAYRRPKTRM